jgi:hypothetical protein
MSIINKIRRALARILWVDPPDPGMRIKIIVYTLDSPDGRIILDMPEIALKLNRAINPNAPLVNFIVAPTQEIDFQVWLHEE